MSDGVDQQGGASSSVSDNRNWHRREGTNWVGHDGWPADAAGMATMDPVFYYPSVDRHQRLVGPDVLAQFSDEIGVGRIVGEIGELILGSNPFVLDFPNNFCEGAGEIYLPYPYVPSHAALSYSLDTESKTPSPSITLTIPEYSCGCGPIDRLHLTEDTLPYKFAALKPFQTPQFELLSLAVLRYNAPNNSDQGTATPAFNLILTQGTEWMNSIEVRARAECNVDLEDCKFKDSPHSSYTLGHMIQDQSKYSIYEKTELREPNVRMKPLKEGMGYLDAADTRYWYMKYMPRNASLFSQPADVIDRLTLVVPCGTALKVAKIPGEDDPLDVRAPDEYVDCCKRLRFYLRNAVYELRDNICMAPLTVHITGESITFDRSTKLLMAINAFFVAAGSIYPVQQSYQLAPLVQVSNVRIYFSDQTHRGWHFTIPISKRDAESAQNCKMMYYGWQFPGAGKAWKRNTHVYKDDSDDEGILLKEGEEQGEVVKYLEGVVRQDPSTAAFATVTSSSNGAHAIQGYVLFEKKQPADFFINSFFDIARLDQRAKGASEGYSEDDYSKRAILSKLLEIGDIAMTPATADYEKETAYLHKETSDKVNMVCVEPASRGWHFLIEVTETYIDALMAVLKNSNAGSVVRTAKFSHDENKVWTQHKETQWAYGNRKISLIREGHRRLIGYVLFPEAHTIEYLVNDFLAIPSEDVVECGMAPSVWDDRENYFNKFVTYVIKGEVEDDYDCGISVSRKLRQAVKAPFKEDLEYPFTYIATSETLLIEKGPTPPVPAENTTNQYLPMPPIYFVSSLVRDGVTGAPDPDAALAQWGFHGRADAITNITNLKAAFTSCNGATTTIEPPNGPTPFYRFIARNMEYTQPLSTTLTRKPNRLEQILDMDSLWGRVCHIECTQILDNERQRTSSFAHNTFKDWVTSKGYKRSRNSLAPESDQDNLPHGDLFTYFTFYVGELIGSMGGRMYDTIGRLGMERVCPALVSGKREMQTYQDRTVWVGGKDGKPSREARVRSRSGDERGPDNFTRYIEAMRFRDYRRNARQTPNRKMVSVTTTAVVYGNQIFTNTVIFPVDAYVLVPDDYRRAGRPIVHDQFLCTWHSTSAGLQAAILDALLTTGDSMSQNIDGCVKIQYVFAMETFDVSSDDEGDDGGQGVGPVTKQLKLDQALMARFDAGGEEGTESDVSETF